MYGCMCVCVYMYVCVHLCMCACICVCMRLCMYVCVCIYVCMCVCLFVCMYVHVCMCVSMYMYVCMPPLSLAPPPLSLLFWFKHLCRKCCTPTRRLKRHEGIQARWASRLKASSRSPGLHSRRSQSPRCLSGSPPPPLARGRPCSQQVASGNVVPRPRPPCGHFLLAGSLI